MRAIALAVGAAAVAVVLALVQPWEAAPLEAQTGGRATSLDEATAVVPADALGLVVLDLSGAQPAAFPFDALTGSGSLLQTAVDETMTHRLGVRVNSLDAVAGYVGYDGESWAVALFGTTSGAPVGGAAAPLPYRGRTIYRFERGGLDGDDLYVAVTDDGLVLGTLAGVTGILDVAFGGVPSVATTRGAADLLAARDPEAVLVAWVGPAALADVEALGLPTETPPSGMLMTVSAERTRWSVDAGSPSAASALDAFVGLTLTQAQSEVEAMSAAADGEDSLMAEMMMRMAAESSTRMLAEGIHHEADGDRFHAEVLSGEGMAWISIAAAVAVPAFLKYIKRSKTTEATMNVRRLYDSSVSYFDADHVTLTGEILPRQFPASVPRTPAEVPCGDAAPANPADWDAPTWQALNFAIVDPHYYSYQYDSSGVGVGATFTATAFGDLDCDGVYSTFLRLGEVDEHMEVRGGAGLYQQNELE